MGYESDGQARFCYDEQYDDARGYNYKAVKQQTGDDNAQLADYEKQTGGNAQHEDHQHQTG
jgi:hypothetical protein